LKDKQRHLAAAEGNAAHIAWRGAGNILKCRPWPNSRVVDRAFAGCDDLLDESKSQEFSLVHKRKRRTPKGPPLRNRSNETEFCSIWTLGFIADVTISDRGA